MTTPEKQYVISQSLVDMFLQIMRNNLQDPDAYDAITELESLPLITGEPVAWAMRNSDGSITEVNSQFVEGIFDIPLSTSQQILQPITADDVTKEMVEAWRTCRYGVRYFNEEIASAVNAWIKHRSIK